MRRSSSWAQRRTSLAGLLGSLRYVREVLGDGGPGESGSRGPSAGIEVLKRPLLKTTLERLLARPRVTLHGVREPEGRVATFCFSVAGHKPRAVAEHLRHSG